MKPRSSPKLRLRAALRATFACTLAEKIHTRKSNTLVSDSYTWSNLRTTVILSPYEYVVASCSSSLAVADYVGRAAASLRSSELAGPAFTALVAGARCGLVSSAFALVAPRLRFLGGGGFSLKGSGSSGLSLNSPHILPDLPCPLEELHDILLRGSSA